jgi:hypothetical protein
MSAPVENQNAVSHGIFSSQIVLPGVERQADWDGHLEGVRATSVRRATWRTTSSSASRSSTGGSLASRASRRRPGPPHPRGQGVRGPSPRPASGVPCPPGRRPLRGAPGAPAPHRDAGTALGSGAAPRAAERTKRIRHLGGEPVTREQQASPVPPVDQEPPRPSRMPILLSPAALEACGHLLGGRQQAPLPMRLQPGALRREPSRLTTGTDTGTHWLLSHQLCDTK